MKFSTIVTTLGLVAAAAMAAPDLSKRQNDVPKCEDGQDPPSKGWRTGTDCQDDCYMKEGKDGDNKNNVCKGMCMNVGHPAPVFACRGKWIKG